NPSGLPVVAERGDVQASREPAVKKVHDVLRSITKRRPVVTDIFDIVGGGPEREFVRKLVAGGQVKIMPFQIRVGNHTFLIQPCVGRADVAAIVASTDCHILRIGDTGFKKVPDVVRLRQEWRRYDVATLRQLGGIVNGTDNGVEVTDITTAN